jgi:Ca2+-transporting ATPase
MPSSPSIPNDKKSVNESSSTTSATPSNKDQVKLTMIDPTQPHSDESNPFAFTPTQLATLMDPKNLPLLSQYGGLQGVARGLYAKLQSGLPGSPETEQIKHAISLNDIIPNDDNEQDGAPEKIERQGTSTSLSSTAATATSRFESRASIFGHNVLPPAKSKNIFELMWMAFKDKTLVRCMHTLWA